jgi:hypothetical protein
MAPQEVLTKATDVIYKEKALHITTTSAALFVAAAALAATIINPWERPPINFGNHSIALVLIYGIVIGITMVITQRLSEHDRRLKRRILTFVWDELIHKRSEINAVENVQNKYAELFGGTHSGPKGFRLGINPGSLSWEAGLQILLLLQGIDKTAALPPPRKSEGSLSPPGDVTSVVVPRRTFKFGIGLSLLGNFSFGKNDKG